MKFFQNLTKLEKALLAILGGLIFTCSCLSLGYFVFGNLSTASTESPPLPLYTVSDFADNGRTNVVYFIVADKSLTDGDAKNIIELYENKHKGYKIINIFIFCDAEYADYEHFEELEAAGEPNDAQYWTHLLYWYYRYESNDLQTDFITGPTGDLPVFGNACK
jgi:hypothetical protein